MSIDASRIVYQQAARQAQQYDQDQIVETKKRDKLNLSLDKLIKFGQERQSFYQDKQDLETWLGDDETWGGDKFKYSRDEGYTSGDYKVSLEDMSAAKVSLEALELQDNPLSLKQYFHMGEHEKTKRGDDPENPQTPIRKMFRSSNYTMPGNTTSSSNLNLTPPSNYTHGSSSGSSSSYNTIAVDDGLHNDRTIASTNNILKDDDTTDYTENNKDITDIVQLLSQNRTDTENTNQEFEYGMDGSQVGRLDPSAHSEVTGTEWIKDAGSSTAKSDGTEWQNTVGNLQAWQQNNLSGNQPLLTESKPFDSGIKSFKDGGKYVTDGPEMIMVGDNNSGKEVVEVTPVEGETGPEAQSGRFGDTKIRVLNGEKQHVTAFEAWLVDSFPGDAEEVILSNTLSKGGPTINPETGLKENFMGIPKLFGEGGAVSGAWEQGAGFMNNMGAVGDALSTALPGAGMAIKAIGAFKGASDMVKQNKKLAKTLDNAISGMERERSAAVLDTQDKLDSVSEDAAFAMNESIASATGTLDSLSANVRKAGAGSKALNTSAVENLIETTQDTTSAAVQMQADKLESSVLSTHDQINEDTEKQMVQLSADLEDANHRLDEAKKMSKFGNALGAQFGF